MSFESLPRRYICTDQIKCWFLLETNQKVFKYKRTFNATELAPQAALSCVDVSSESLVPGLPHFGHQLADVSRVRGRWSVTTDQLLALEHLVDRDEMVGHEHAVVVVERCHR